MLKHLLLVIKGIWNPTLENGFKPAGEPIVLFLVIGLVMIFGPVVFAHLLYELGMHEHPAGNRYRGGLLPNVIGCTVLVFGWRAMSFMFPANWYRARNRHGHHTLNWWQNMVYWGVFVALLINEIR